MVSEANERSACKPLAVLGSVVSQEDVFYTWLVPALVNTARNGQTEDARHRDGDDAVAGPREEGVERSAVRGEPLVALLGGGELPLIGWNSVLVDAGGSLHVDDVLRSLVALELEPVAGEVGRLPESGGEEGEAGVVEIDGGGALVTRGAVAERLEQRRVELHNVVRLDARLERVICKSGRGEEPPSMKRFWRRASASDGAGANRQGNFKRQLSAAPLEIVLDEVVPEPLRLWPALVGDKVSADARGHEP